MPSTPGLDNYLNQQRLQMLNSAREANGLAVSIETASPRRVEPEVPDVEILTIPARIRERLGSLPIMSTFTISEQGQDKSA